MLVYGRAHRIPHHGSKSVVDERQLRRQRMRSKRHSRCEINCRNPATPLVLLSPRLIFARSACTSFYLCACESTNDSARELITSLRCQQQQPSLRQALCTRTRAVISGHRSPAAACVPTVAVHAHTLWNLSCDSATTSRERSDHQQLYRALQSHRDESSVGVRFDARETTAHDRAPHRCSRRASRVFSQMN